LEDELEAERDHRRAADGEIIKLRAAMGGVHLSDSDVNALLPKAMESLPPVETDTIDEGDEDDQRLDERYVILWMLVRFFVPFETALVFPASSQQVVPTVPPLHEYYLHVFSILLHIHTYVSEALS
jgi:hypothetical protein